MREGQGWVSECIDIEYGIFSASPETCGLRLTIWNIGPISRVGDRPDAYGSNAPRHAVKRPSAINCNGVPPTYDRHCRGGERVGITQSIFQTRRV
jgi:hypothetical protein